MIEWGVLNKVGGWVTSYSSRELALKWIESGKDRPRGNNLALVYREVGEWRPDAGSRKED